MFGAYIYIIYKFDKKLGTKIAIGRLVAQRNRDGIKKFYFHSKDSSILIAYYVILNLNSAFLNKMLNNYN